MAVSAWRLVCGLDAWRVTQIPRRPGRLPPAGTDDDGDLLTAQRAAALSAAYHGGAGPVRFAWVRDPPGGPVQVLADGLARALGALPCWVRIAGVADSLLAQLETITRWHHDDQRDTGRGHAVAWGQRPGAALASAIGAKAGEADWDERVVSQLSHFTTPCRWPLDHLTMSEPGHG